MKRQDLVALRQKTAAQLNQEVQKLEVSLVDTRIKRGLGQVRNVHTESSLRRDIAQIKTILGEMNLAATISKPATTEESNKNKKATA